MALEGLVTLLDTEPTGPTREVLAGFDDLDEPWFWITDLVWEGDTVITIGGLTALAGLRIPTARMADDCGMPQTMWTRNYDAGDR